MACIAEIVENKLNHHESLPLLRWYWDYTRYSFQLVCFINSKKLFELHKRSCADEF